MTELCRRFLLPSPAAVAGRFFRDWSDGTLRATHWSR